MNIILKKKSLVYALCVSVVSLTAFGTFYYAGHTKLRLTGIVDANQVILSSQLDGRINKLLVSDGQDVKQGDVIATIDERVLQADFEAAQANYAEIVASRKQQDDVASRSSKLVTSGVVSFQVAEGDKRQLEALRAKETAAAKAVDAAKTRLNYTKIYAPTNGRISTTVAREGEFVSSGNAIAIMTDLSQTWVYVWLPETYADDIMVSDAFPVTMPGGTQLNGQVIAKAAEADFATQRDTDGEKRDIRTIRIKLQIPNADGRFVPGMTAVTYLPRDKGGV